MAIAQHRERRVLGEEDFYDLAICERGFVRVQEIFKFNSDANGVNRDRSKKIFLGRKKGLDAPHCDN